MFLCVCRINKVDDSSEDEYYDEEYDGEDKTAAQYQSAPSQDPQVKNQGKANNSDQSK